MGSVYKRGRIWWIKYSDHGLEPRTEKKNLLCLRCIRPSL